MPAIQRPNEMAEEYPVAPAPASPVRTPWVFLAGLIVGLLVIGGGYLLISGISGGDSSAPPASSSSPSTGSDGAQRESEGSAQNEANGSFGGQVEDEPPLGDEPPAEVSKTPSTPSAGQGGATPGGGCKVSSMPKSTGGQIAQEVTIECAEPTSLQIEPQGQAVIEHDGQEHDSAFTVCSDEVTFLVMGGGYSWDREGSC